MLEKAKLEEVFGKEFRDDGDNFVACCPVHNESTPSFHVHKKYMLVNCFGCGAKGGLVTFVRRFKSVSTQEALDMLGIELHHYVIPLVKFKEDRKPPQIYPDSWLAPFKGGVHKYVLNRGFNQGILQDAETVYDSSLKRQVFPHRRRDGKLVGAVGRACRGQDPKWYYYWKYEKSRYLYTPTKIPSRSSVVWVVEGVFDVLWLLQHGYSAVAILGSKASDDQISEIKNHYSEVILALDNDEAGDSGRQHLYKNLRRSCCTYFPVWPTKANDIMDVDPGTLSLLNPIEKTLVNARQNSAVLPAS